MKEKSKVFCIIGSHKRSMIDLLFVEGDFFFFFDNRGCLGQFARSSTNPTGP